MEILILSSLAYIGFELSKEGKVPRRILNNTKIPERCNKFPIKSDTHPPIPTELHNNTVPYFKSAKTQNTNDAYKQRNLETFTGTDSIGFQSKREREPMFQPQANLSHIHGTQLSLDDNNRKERYSNNVTNIMNNVAPIEKQYVGPGLNTESTAKGGFHDMYRILPNNVDSYKKHTFGGRVVAGKGVTNQRDSLPSISDNKKPERYYKLCDVPVSQTSAPVTANSIRSDTIVQDTQRGNCNNPIGIAGPANMSHAVTLNSQYATRDYDRSNCATHGNPSMSGYGSGAYTTTSVLVSEGQREQCNNELLNVQNQQSGGGVYITDGAVPTQREMHNVHNGHMHNSSMVASQNNHGYAANPTAREQNSVAYNGNPTQRGIAFENRTYDAQSTMRGNTMNNYNAPAASIHRAAVNYDSAKNACTYMQREEMGRSYTPGGGNMNICEDAHNIHPHMIVKDDCNNDKYVAPVKGPNAITTGAMQGNVEYVPKVQVHNNRLDLSIAEKQLSNNDIAHNINM